MVREPNDVDPPTSDYWSTRTISSVVSLTCFVVYVLICPKSTPAISSCCKGIQNLELVGKEVRLLKVNTPKECCEACKASCEPSQRNCSCTSWSFCGHKRLCASRFGECRLRKQRDELTPLKIRSPLWTSGINFGAQQGIVGLKTDYGTAQIKLLPNESPVSVSVMLDLLRFGSCAECKFYRAEGRGIFWDSDGRHIEGSRYGPPYGLVQGTLDAYGMPFEVEPEYQPKITRGSVAWVGSGPEFFVSLADHYEWKRKYTVFGVVLPQDMWVFEKMSALPTKLDVWKNISVSVLRQPVSISIRRRVETTSAYDT